MPEQPTYQDLEKRIEAQDKEINTLRKTNKKYLHIINSMSEAYSEVDLRGNFTFFNDAVPKFHGRSREEMMGLSYREYQTPEQRKRIFEIYNRVFRIGDSEEIKDFEIIKKDGTIGTTEATVSLLRDDSGEPIGFSCFRRDVEKEKKIQDALQEREETYRRILETAPDSIVIMRRSDSKILEVNKAFCQQTGYNREEVIGRTPLELNLFANLTDRQQLLEKMEENNGQVDGMQVTYQAKDGSLLHDLVSIRNIQFKGEECVLTVATVINPIIEAQNALRESEEKYRKILELAPDTIALSRLSDGTYLEVNDMFCRRTGYTREEAIGRTAEELGIYYNPEDRDRMLKELRKKNGRLLGFEIRYCDRNGAAGDILISAVIIPFQGEECLLAISKNITNLKNTQKALQKSEEKYRKILETMEEGYYEVDLAGYITFFNEAMIRIYGYPPDEMMGLNNRDFLSPEEAKRVFAILSEVYRTGTPAKLVDHEIIRKDGSKRFVEMSASAIRNESGETVGFRGIVRDITDRKEAQKALQESEEKYRKILETMEEGYYEVDLAGNNLFLNDAMGRIYGYPLDEMMGMSYKNLTSPEEAKKVYSGFNKVYRTGKPARALGHEIIRKDGARRFVESSATLMRNESGEPFGFCGIIRDVTERKQMEKALKKSEEKYRNILETMEDGYFETDLAGNFTFLNSAMCKNYGYSHDELIGMNNRKYTSGKEAKRIYGVYNQIYKTGNQANIFDQEVICKDESIRILETSASLLKNVSGEPIGFRGITRNVTERKKAEKELDHYRKNLEKMVKERTRELESTQEELVKKEKLAVLGQLTATVSHELRNPLGVIRSSNFYLHRKVNEQDPKIDKHFRRIEEQVSICDSIVADLLEYTRGRHVEVLRNELNSWLDPLLDELLKLEGVTVKKHLTGSTLVPHDQEKIRRLIINITDNALQAVKAKREAWKDREKTYDPEIFIGTSEVDNGVIIEIRDNGIGMDRETLDRALEPLFTTRARGTGLGLANVDKIVKEHKGKITIESKPDQGTSLAIFLPNKTV